MAATDSGQKVYVLVHVASSTYYLRPHILHENDGTFPSVLCVHFNSVLALKTGCHRASRIQSLCDVDGRGSRKSLDTDRADIGGAEVVLLIKTACPVSTSRYRPVYM